MNCSKIVISIQGKFISTFGAFVLLEPHNLRKVEFRSR
jgi:hypothetical protein